MKLSPTVGVGQGVGMDWARILAYGTGTVDQELLARNEYLAAENRIIKAQLKGRLKLSDAERGALGEIGHRLGRKVLADVATIARPDTILGWYCKLVACKFDGSKARRGPGRPRIKWEVEQAHDDVGRLHSDPRGVVGGDRLLYRRGADAARAGDLLRAVLHPSREPPGIHRWDHRSSQ
jgi:hypothetical protein